MISAEVVGRFEEASDCDGLLYEPLGGGFRYRRTRYYEVGFEGEREAAEAFVRAVFFDEVSETLSWGGEGVFDGALFRLDYGMRPGVLDLEREAVVRYFGELEAPGFELTELVITHRLYVFGEGGATVGPERFIRDVTNPAIHRWAVSEPAAGK